MPWYLSTISCGETPSWRARILVLPVLFPVGSQLFRSRDISDRRIEPDIQHLAVGPFDRNRNPPIQVAAHRPRLQAQIEPTLTLAVYVTLPLLMAIENPFAQELFVPVQRQEPVLRFAQHGRRPGDRAFGTDQVGGVERTAAFFALVAVGAFVLAMRAGADDIAVGEELSRLLIVILLRSLLDKFTVVVKLPEKIRCGLVVRGGRGARIDVERHAQTAERLLDNAVVLVDDILRGNPLLAGLYRNGYAVFVRSANRNDILAPQAQVTRIDVRRNIDSGQVADMYGTVGVRKRRSNQVAFEFLHRKDQLKYWSLPLYPLLRAHKEQARAPG